MLLRASSEIEDRTTPDLTATTSSSKIVLGRPGVSRKAVLSALVESVLADDDALIQEARDRAIQVLGAGGWIDALLVLSFFQMVDRVANGSGVRLEANVVQVSDFIGELGIGEYRSAESTPPLSWWQRATAPPIRRLLALYVEQERSRRRTGDPGCRQ